MAVSAKRMRAILRRHGALVSAVTAAAVAGVIAVQRLLSILVGFIGSSPSGDGGLWAAVVLQSALLPAVPFALGYFASLWLIAPIAAELRLPHVITRAVLATGIGCSVLFIVLAVLALVGAFSTAGGSLAGNSFPFPVFAGEAAVRGLANALTSVLQEFILSLPLGVLAGVLLWHWRKDHPPKEALSGFIDEV